jgi:hypothetical protein
VQLCKYRTRQMWGGGGVNLFHDLKVCNFVMSTVPMIMWPLVSLIPPVPVHIQTYCFRLCCRIWNPKMYEKPRYFLSVWKHFLSFITKWKVVIAQKYKFIDWIKTLPIHATIYSFCCGYEHCILQRKWNVNIFQMYEHLRNILLLYFF